MKRRQSPDWEELRDPDSIPRDVKDTRPSEALLPDGEKPQEDYAWRRPEKDYTAETPAIHGEVRSSEALYRRASAAKSQRAPEPDEPQFYDSGRSRRLLFRGLVTLVLVLITGALLLAIKAQLDLRSDILKQSAEASLRAAAAETTVPVNQAAVTETKPQNLPEVSVAIVGSWASRGEIPEETQAPAATTAPAP